MTPREMRVSSEEELPPDTAARRQRLDDLYFGAYAAAQYRKWGVNEVPAGLDAEERRAYEAGLAAGDADRRQA